MNNWDRINSGFDILLKVLVKYEVHELAAEYGPKSWWGDGVEPILSTDQRRNSSHADTDEGRILALDVAMVLDIIDRRWGEVFRKKLPRDCRTWANELKGFRIKVAHRGVQDISDDDAYRALDTMQRLCSELDNSKAEPLRALMREVRYGSADGSAHVKATEVDAISRKKTSTATLSVSDLPSWREVVTPHPDVAEGRYRKAEFAADLAQVARHTAVAEYQDPIEFFSRTYMTAGIKGLLNQALRRVSGQDGEPVIQLKTAFGGGKTHSMLALYHLLRGGFDITKVSSVRDVLTEAGLEHVPSARVAVIVGTALDPSKSRRPQTMPGITVNTVWGEIAFQLAEAAGDPSLYDYVKDADKRHVSPGSEALTALLDAAGPCLVLIDEFVAYAKKLYGVDDLPAGSFDNLITFVQELTEAARASKASLVVASIPESEREIGGEAGKRALDAIEHTFGRMESIWNPVTANEGFSVVSRRLFSTDVDEEKRDEICQAYAKMYRDNTQDFPVEARESDYYDRMVACFPIHPEVYDRLYEDWSSIEGFQRTRGVLRFMAAVIHELWIEGDQSPLIMVGSLPFDVAPVRDELTRYLGDNWNAIVDAEVDGRNSEPFKADSANNRFGRMFACRRIARTVFLGSAPDVKGQNARGIDKAQINLGILRPGDNIPLFADALNTLKARSSYFYSDSLGTRFWYDTRPTLRKTVDNRAQSISDDIAIQEAERRMKSLPSTLPLQGVHACPQGSLDVPDEKRARLVIFGLKAPHRQGDAASAAREFAKDCLATRGTAPRAFKNCLVFLAPEASAVAPLLSEVKQYLAWKSVEADKDRLDLTSSQVREAKAGMQASSQTVDIRLDEAYGWLLVPQIDLESGSMEILWEETKVPAGVGTMVERTARKLVSEEALISRWSPMLLKMSLDRLLWQDSTSLPVGQLWTQLCSYCYLPRLVSFDVLASTISEGASSSDFFGIASGEEEGRYINLTLGDARPMVYESDVLVRPDVARSQIDKDRAKLSSSADKDEGTTEGVGSNGASGVGNEVGAGTTSIHSDGVSEVQPVEFLMDKQLDPVRVNHDVQLILEEVVSHLEREGANIELTLHVEAYTDGGFDVPLVRMVSENCKTLGAVFEFNR